MDVVIYVFITSDNNLDKEELLESEVSEKSDFTHGRNCILQLTDGEMLLKWKDDEIIECFVSSHSFGWWFREKGKGGPIIYLYFDNKPNLRKAENWIKTNYPSISIWEVVIADIKRKSWT
ncbi:4560_t:CDS:2 [Diversispora eburnea]|uniref:4560_t:CDS:1 n=1 Tax=Diversispora eburnea TaxID=1213867 RepID=A0A9N9G1N2_9GLOM|nr:4560_t:CDS:2 [Diversispora eburnea]